MCLIGKTMVTRLVDRGSASVGQAKGLAAVLLLTKDVHPVLSSWPQLYHVV